MTTTNAAQCTLTYSTDRGPVTHQLTAAAVDKVGMTVARSARTGRAWGIKVTDAAGGDITSSFRCFNT